MNLRTYLATAKHRQRQFAESLGVTQGLISQWARGKALPPPKRCVAIERLTQGEVTRKELRPDDWAEHWPELAQAASLQEEGV
ncbi:Cro/CI family transcriptional regulator [Paraburkholderia xenovorans]|jgi:DNA-binding transcriptional regulator YdaS (Cro superfamily)